MISVQECIGGWPEPARARNAPPLSELRGLEAAAAD